MNGEIVRAAARDNTLWTPVSNNTNYGIAWAVGTNNRRRIAQHSGTWDGAHSYIRIYRDNGLVVAIMSNRATHASEDLPSLTSKIAAIVL